MPNPPPDTSDLMQLLTIKRASEIAEVSVATLRRAIRGKRLPIYCPSLRTRRINKADLVTYLASRRRGGR